MNKLIDILKMEYNLETNISNNKIYTLGPERLRTILHKLKSCEEFKNCEILIVPSSKFELYSESGIKSVLVGTTKIPTNEVFVMDYGTFYLYQVNTIDFINFDIRGAFVDTYQVNWNLSPFELVNQIPIFDLSELEKEQKEIIQEDINLLDVNGKYFTNHVEDINRRIEYYKLENKAEQYKIKNDNGFSDFLSKCGNLSSIVKEKEEFNRSVNQIQEWIAPGETRNSGFRTNEMEQTAHIANNLRDSQFITTSRETIKTEEEKDSYSTLLSDISSIEKTLNDCDGLDDEQVSFLKDRIKTFENRLKDKIKPKTITISSTVHNKIKRYCTEFGLKIGDWVEETLLKELTVLPYSKTTEEDIKKEKEDIIKRYYEYKKTNKLLKSDKLIFFPNFKFIGYSKIDFMPIYDYIGTDKQFEKIAERIISKISLIVRDEVTEKYLPEFEETPVEGLGY